MTSQQDWIDFTCPYLSEIQFVSPPPPPPSGVTESLFIYLFFFFFFLGGGQRGGAQEDGIALKGAQQKSQMGGGGNGGPWCEWGGHAPSRPPIVTPLLPLQQLTTTPMGVGTMFVYILLRRVWKVKLYMESYLAQASRKLLKTSGNAGTICCERNSRAKRMFSHTVSAVCVYCTHLLHICAKRKEKVNSF